MGMNIGDIIEYRNAGKTHTGTVINISKDVVTITQPLNGVRHEVEKDNIRNIKKSRG